MNDLQKLEEAYETVLKGGAALAYAGKEMKKIIDSDRENNKWLEKIYNYVNNKTQDRREAHFEKENILKKIYINPFDEFTSAVNYVKSLKGVNEMVGLGITPDVILKLEELAQIHDRGLNNKGDYFLSNIHQAKPKDIYSDKLRNRLENELGN